MLRASLYEIGTTAIVPLIVPVTLFGYSVAMGFGEESLLALRIYFRKRVGIVNEFARLKSSKMGQRVSNCMLKKQH